MSLRQEMKIFTGTGGRSLCTAICDKLGLPVSPATVGRWKNGEVRVQLEDHVRGKDVFIVQCAGEPVNEQIMEVLLMLDAARRASAERITAVLPYFPYSKQEKKTRGREPIAAKVLLDMLICAGVDRLVAVDLHAAAIQGFANQPIDHLSAGPVFAAYLQQKGYITEGTVIVSPDAGGAERGLDLSSLLQCDFAIVFKRHPRSDPQSVEVIDMVGDVKGKTAIILDDMILSGATLIDAAKILLDRDAKEVMVCASHAFLAGDSAKELNESGLSKLIVTDSLPVPAEKRVSKMEIVSLADLLSKVIRRIHENRSVSEMINEVRRLSRAAD